MDPVPLEPLPVMSGGISCLAHSRHRLRLDLDLPRRVEQRRHDAGRGGPDLAEDLSVGARDVAQVRGVGDEHSRADDVARPTSLPAASASAMIERQSRACSYALSGVGEPSGGIGAVPATWTVEPTTTAREYPAIGSNGECPEIRRRSIVGVVSLIERGSSAPDRRLGRPVRRCRSDRAPARRSRPVATRAAPCGLRRSRSPSSALATLVAAEEGVVDLDEPAGPPGSTVRHLLAHASGLPFDGTTPIAPPGRRRIYSNEGFAVLGDAVAAGAEMPFADYVRAAVCEPLGIALDPEGHPGAGMHALPRRRARARRGSCSRPRSSLARPTPRWWRSSSRASTACCPTSVASAPLDWGLGVELKTTKQGHWSGSLTSPTTFGHFGGSGTFLWVDPDATARVRRPDDAASSASGRRRPGRRLSDAVIRELGS